VTFRSVFAQSRSGSPAAGFRAAAAARVTFLCLPTHAQERVRTAKPARRAEGRMPGVKKSNQKKGPPDDAPSGLAPSRCACGVTGFFDRASCPGEKLAGIHAGHPAGFPPPARRVIRGPRRAKTGSRANSRPLRGVRSLVGAHLVRDHRRSGYNPALRSRTRCAPTRVGHAGSDGCMRGAMCGSAPCARQPRWGVPLRRFVAHRVRSHRQASTPMRLANADAQRGPALSPQRFGRVAQRMEVPAVWPPMDGLQQPSSTVRAYPNTMLRAFQAIFFGLLSTRS
jgi:hypothetical protein